MSMKKRHLDWLNQAKRDFKHAKHSLEDEDYEWACFATQQAAEKALKALQIQRLGRFDGVHDLLTLADSVKAPNKIIECCIKLTPYYTTTRYPDVGEPITEETVKELLEESKKVIEWVERNVK